ncbi:hypothetical protein KIW84_012913 [Lathyrus oleraceus]|uniref:Helitron helicase-like domain-containing protein n=1 Tax=Pisum sativum TaxID=3888 RepID=A0A9D5BIY5_PEA|nr:hypothetical protein KIW84_012913 [Pisum sativum]
MKAIELQNISPKGYFFKDFGEILQGKCKTDRLEDIIGAVSEINHIKSNTPGKKVVVSVVLKDLKGNCINCNLWEIYGSKFLAYYNDPKNNGAIVILLTHAMVKDGQVSNAWSDSKLLINEDIPEIQDFMFKLPTNEQKEKPTQSLKSLSNWSGGSQYSPVERFVHNAKYISWEEATKRNRLTIREWLTFRIQSRSNEAQTLLRSRRLYQQFLVDGFTMMESERLRWLRKNQSKLRVGKYHNLNEYNSNGETHGSNTGKRVVLPSSYVGSRRYMDQLYFDGMVICSYVGFPDLFITFTCNPNWPEIQRLLGSVHLKASDRPDIISRVFKMKFD